MHRRQGLGAAVRALDVARAAGSCVSSSATTRTARPVRWSTKRGVTRSYVYDPSGLFVAEEHVEPSPPQELVWRAHVGPRHRHVPTSLGPDGHHSRRRYDALGRVAGFALDDLPEHRSIDYDWTAPAPKTTVWEFDGPPDAAGGAPGDAGRRVAAGARPSEVANGLGEVRYQARRLDAGHWIVERWKERDPNSRVVFEGQPTTVTALELTARPSGMVGLTRTFDPLGRPIQEVDADRLDAPLHVHRVRAHAQGRRPGARALDVRRPRPRARHRSPARGRHQRARRGALRRRRSPDAALARRRQQGHAHRSATTRSGASLSTNDPDLGARSFTLRRRRSPDRPRPTPSARPSPTRTTPPAA